MIITPEKLQRLALNDTIALCDAIVATVERRAIARIAGRAAARLSLAEGVTIDARKVA